MKRMISIIRMIALLALPLAALGMTSCGGKSENRTQMLTEGFENIEILTNTSVVTVLPSSDGECKLVCNEKKDITHTAEIKDGILKISVKDERSWFKKLFGANLSVTLYLPTREYGSLRITSNTGNVTIDSVQCTALTVKLDTGNVTLQNSDVSDVAVGTDTGNVKLDRVSCTILAATTDTGKITLTDTIAKGKFDLVANTGDILFERCDAESFFAKTDTGDVRGSFLTDKIIFADTKTGKVDTPKLTSGGKCEITTTTGDIKITIE